MPEKYHIETKPVPPRLARIGKYGVVDWREDCARCHNCVKKACVYDRHRQETEYIRRLNDVDALFFDCMGCFSCVQNCTKGLLGLVVNPVYEGLGNGYWTPEIIQTTWMQAETAKIPVSGAGYRGPFSGPGFDSMWTDMSEIVRPTRDGIHGREYISTSVDIGRKPPFLAFESERLAGAHPPLVSIPMPLIIDVASPQHTLPALGPILREAARRTGLIAIVNPRDWPFEKDDGQRFLSHVAFRLDPGAPTPPKDVLDQTRLVELPDGPDVLERIRQFKNTSPQIVVSVKVALDSNGCKRAIELADLAEIEVVHVAADLNGNEIGAQNPRFIKDRIREIHTALVENGRRDEITLMASGGIALAEHLAKAIICGADLVAVNLPLLIALECQLCNRCEPGMLCPAKLEKIDFEYGVGRMTNLIAAWHDQLIEVMGAMGMREVRRLRGDVGRAMFFEPLEEETFGKLRGEAVIVARASRPCVARPSRPCYIGEQGQDALATEQGQDALATEQGQDALATNEGETPSPRNLKELLPEKTFLTRVPQVKVTRQIKPAPSRYRNDVAKYIIRRSSDCIRCGKCVQLCPYGVHVDKPGYKYFAEPRLDLCIGPACSMGVSPMSSTAVPAVSTTHRLPGNVPVVHGRDAHVTHGQDARATCVAQCPQGALRMVENPMMKALGDYRWTADMILATWKMAETGDVPAPEYGYEYHCGASGGGFDKLRFKFPDKPPIEIDESEIDTSIELNRRNDDRPRIRIDVPWYGGGMSFGSVSNVTQLSKARCAVAWNTFTCTGEGGYMERLRPYDDHVITQVATGLFGVREETIQRVPIVEFKYAQGAKPGLGGHLLGDKNTVAVSKMREAVLGISLFSPFPFHSVYSIEDHMKHLDWIKHVNRRALVSTKVSTPTDVDMVAVGSCAAGTHIVHLDGGYGGTGAAPDIAKKNIAMPIEYAIGRVHAFLEAEGVRDTVTLIASGGIRTAHDIAKAIALGADGVVVGTGELVALGCVRCTRCESGRGCPRGIATTDPELSAQMGIEWGTQRLINLYAAWRKQLVQILRRLGLRSVGELRGRTDLLMHLDYADFGRDNGIKNLDRITGST